MSEGGRGGGVGWKECGRRRLTCLDDCLYRCPHLISMTEGREGRGVRVGGDGERTWGEGGDSNVSINGGKCLFQGQPDILFRFPSLDASSPSTKR